MMDNKEKKQLTKTQKALIGGGVVVTGVCLGVLAYTFGFKPPKVENPNWRAFFRSDGVPKKTFDKAWKANVQTLKQLVKHGEICPAYEIKSTFRTGHHPGWIRSLKDIA